ncbi:MAG: alanine racemase [Candidatus Babeliales bacterium]
MNPITFIEICKSAFDRNMRALQAHATPQAFMMPVIKSNAYGHGLLEIAQLCQAHTAVYGMCVVALSEAVFLRVRGITKPIVVLNIIDADIAQAVHHNITLTVHSELLVRHIEQIAQQLRVRATVHVKIDVGLHRAGIVPDTITHMLTQWIRKSPSLHWQGAYTHLSDPEDSALCLQQIQQFNHTIAALAQQNIYFDQLHYANSGVLFMQGNERSNLIRPGIAVYGIWPSRAIEMACAQSVARFTLVPLLSFKTTIIQTKWIAAGDAVGYNQVYSAQRPTRIGLLPVGYADGYNRHLSNCAQVLTGSRYAPVIGRISMNLTTIDITDVVEAGEGTVVTLIGAQQPIHVSTLAQMCNTIPYEILTGIRASLPRVMVD